MGRTPRAHNDNDTQVEHLKSQLSHRNQNSSATSQQRILLYGLLRSPGARVSVQQTQSSRVKALLESVGVLRVATLRFGLPALSILFSLVLSQMNVQAAEVDELRVGVYAGVGQLGHKAGFSSLPVYTNQFASYRDTTALGWNFGLSGYYRLQSWYGLQCRLGLSSMGATLASREFIGNQENNGQLVAVYSQHELTSSLLAMNLEPGVLLQPLETLPLSFELSYSFGLWLQKSFTQSETLSPEAIALGYRFSDANGTVTTTRSKGSGSLPSTKPWQSLNAGLRYDLQLGSRTRIGLGAVYHYPLSEIVSTTGWKISQLALHLDVGIALRSQHIEEESVVEPKVDSSQLNHDPVVLHAKQDSIPHQQVDNRRDSVQSHSDNKTPEQPRENVLDSIAQQASREDTAKKTKDSAEREQSIVKAKVDTVLQSQGATLIPKGCIAIMFSSESKAQAQRVLAEVLQSGVRGAELQMWYDSSDKTRYYRVQAPVLSDDDLPNIKSCLVQSKSKIRRLLSPVLKCDE